MMGATVKMRVTCPFGLLRALEWLPDVHVIDRRLTGRYYGGWEELRVVDGREYKVVIGAHAEEIWLLRSMDFPRSWDGLWISPVFITRGHGRNRRDHLLRWGIHAEG